MLTFSRSKIVGIEREGDTMLAHGFLDDNIYSLELDVKVKLPELEIVSAEGKMRRHTTSVCPSAAAKLQNAVGLRIPAHDFSAKVKRVVGREGCRHFADLLLECCSSVAHASAYDEWRKLRKKKDADKDGFLKHKLESTPWMKDSCMVYSGDSPLVKRLNVKW